MGYLTDIIKDSRLNPAGRRSRDLLVPDPDQKPWPDVTETGGRIPGRPARRLARQLPSAAAEPIESNALPAEADSPPLPIARQLPRVEESPANRTRHPGSGHEPTDPGGSIETSAGNLTLPVIQRKASTAAAPRSDGTGAPAVNGLLQPDLPVGARPARRGSAARRPVGAEGIAAGPERPSRRGAPVTVRRDATPPQNTRLVPPEPAPLQAAAVAVAEAAPRSGGRLKRAAESAIPVGARFREKPANPALPDSATDSVQPPVSADTAPGGRFDGPRVQIGQVNVIVEESRVPPERSPADHRSNDSASRTFLRSL